MLKALHPGLRSRTINIKQTWSDAPKRFADPLQEAHSACPYSSSQAPTCLQPCPGGSDTLLALDRFPSTQESETFQGLIWSEISAPILHTSKELLPRCGEMYLSVSKDGPRKGTKTKKSNKETQDKTNKQTNKIPAQNTPKPSQSWLHLEKGSNKVSFHIQGSWTAPQVTLGACRYSGRYSGSPQHLPDYFEQETRPSATLRSAAKHL